MKKNYLVVFGLILVVHVSALIAITRDQAVRILELQEPVTLDMVYDQARVLLTNIAMKEYTNQADKKHDEEKIRNINNARDFFELEFSSSIKPAQKTQQSAVPSVKTYATIQEALDGVVMNYPFNKSFPKDSDFYAWNDVLNRLQGYIKGINANRGLLQKISSKNMTLFEKALKLIMNVSATFITLLKTSQLNAPFDVSELKNVSQNLHTIQIELKPVTTGLLKDYEITQQIKDLLSMVAAKLEDSCKKFLK